MTTYHEQPLKTQSKPWGAWATAFWTLLIAGLFMVLSGAVVFIQALLTTHDLFSYEPDAIQYAISQLALDADVVFSGYIICALILTPIVLLISKKGGSAVEFLALNKRPSIAHTFTFIGFLIAYFIISEAITYFAQIEYPQSMLDMKHSIDNLLVMWIAVVIVAPIFEELVFRGFLFKGLINSPMAKSGTIFITSLLFTLIHGGQYQFELLAMLFCMSLILGFSRLVSGSIYLPILLHLINNLLSQIQLMYFI